MENPANKSSDESSDRPTEDSIQEEDKSNRTAQNSTNSDRFTVYDSTEDKELEPTEVKITYIKEKDQEFLDFLYERETPVSTREITSYTKHFDTSADVNYPAEKWSDRFGLIEVSRMEGDPNSQRLFDLTEKGEEFVQRGHHKTRVFEMDDTSGIHEEELEELRDRVEQLETQNRKLQNRLSTVEGREEKIDHLDDKIQGLDRRQDRFEAQLNEWYDMVEAQVRGFKLALKEEFEITVGKYVEKIKERDDYPSRKN